MEHLSDAELKVMDWLWQRGEASAKQIADSLSLSIGWNKNTTYTLLKRLMEKGAMERIDPGFHCRALITRAEVQQQEAGAMLNKLFKGSAASLFAALVDGQRLPENEKGKLIGLIDELKQRG